MPILLAVVRHLIPRFPKPTLRGNQLVCNAVFEGKFEISLAVRPVEVHDVVICGPDRSESNAARAEQLKLQTAALRSAPEHRFIHGKLVIDQVFSGT